MIIIKFSDGSPYILNIIMSIGY